MPVMPEPCSERVDRRGQGEQENRTPLFCSGGASARRPFRLYGERPSDRPEEMPPDCLVRRAALRSPRGDAARGAVRRTRRRCRPIVWYGERPSDRPEEMPPGGPCGVLEEDVARGAVRRTKQRGRRLRAATEPAKRSHTIRGSVDWAAGTPGHSPADECTHRGGFVGRGRVSQQ